MNYYNEIKKELIDNEIYKKVKDYSKNKYELEKYYNVGKLLIEAQGGEERAKYGNKLIKEYSTKLITELGKKYTYTTLSRMRQFYLIYEIIAPMAQHLNWSHIQELLPIKDSHKLLYYANQVQKYNWSKYKLREKIKSNEYERLDETTRNKLITNEKLSISDEIKHPIVIKNKYDMQDISERMLKRLILDDMDSFLSELGVGFTYVGNEYKIKIGNVYNCIDKEIKTIYQDKTIGIIITKKDNQFIMEYCSDSKIYQTTYQLI